MSIILASRVRYVINVALIVALAVLFWQADPFFAATTAKKSFALLPIAWQLGVAAVSLLAFALLGGRLITAVALLFCLVFFLPDISHPAWDETVWKAASWWVESKSGPRISPVYMQWHRWASLAVYVVGFVIALRIFSALRRRLDH